MSHYNGKDLFVDYAFDDFYDLHDYLKERFSLCGIMDFSSPSRMIGVLLDNITVSEHYNTCSDEEKETTEEEQTAVAVVQTVVISNS